MKNAPLVLAYIVLLFTSCMAQAQPPTSRQITVLADFSDRSQFTIENRLFAALEKLAQSGNLAGLGLDDSRMVVNTGQADGKALLDSWNLSQADLPLLAITTVTSEGSHPELLWYWRVDNVPTAIRALEDELGIAAGVPLPAIRAADFTPKAGPLSAGASIVLMLQGTEGCSATFDIGGAVGLPLFEMESGLYRGEYVVKPEDKTDADITVHLSSESGASVSKLLGHLVLQGLAAPHLHSVLQISSGEWLLTGTAPPNSLVSVTAVMKQTFIFKFKSVNSFEGAADASGQFQLKAYIEENVAGSEATFTATATVGQASESSEQKMTFQGLPRRYDPPPATSFTPWSLAGGWYHGNRSTSIRVNGRDSVVIRNESGQHTVLYLVGVNRLESRDTFGLTGRVDRQTIHWNNGTRWDRSRFR
jgi:hypothetical protein